MQRPSFVCLQRIANSPFFLRRKENTNVRIVQFVMKTAEIFIPDEAVGDFPGEEPTQTVWVRFKNLFAFLRRG